MPDNILLSGPAGSGKSQIAREMLREGKVDIVADFQSILASLLLLERDPNTGRYPPRDRQAINLVPTAQYLRSRVITEARNRDLRIVATNSNGDPEQRQRLLVQLAGVERIIDPGREVVEQRLSDTITGQLTDQCREAINRWYDNLATGGVLA